jgi:hypothetical protein
MPFLVQISPTGKPIFIGGAAEDINEQPDPELLGEKIVDRTINSRQIASIAGYATGTGTMRAGSLVLEAILLSVQQYREELQAVEPKAQIYDVDQMDENLSVLFPGDERVGNIINEFKVDGVNSYQLLYDGTGWFAGGKISWTYVGDEAQLVVDGEIIARTGILENLSVEGTLLMDTGGVITNLSNDFIIDKDGIRIPAGSTYFQERSISVGEMSVYALSPGFENFIVFDSAGIDTWVFAPNGRGPARICDIIFNMPEGGAPLFPKSKFILRNGRYYFEDLETSARPDGDEVWRNGNFLSIGTSAGTPVVANATADNHALNRITGDNRYWTREDLRIEDAGAGTITANRTITFEVEGATYAVNAQEI